MYLPSEVLASLAFANYGVRVGDGGRPEEALSVSLAYKGSCRGVVAADARVDVLEESSTVLFRYTSHEDARRAFTVKLAPDHCVASAAPRDPFGLRAIFGEFIVQQVIEVRSGPLGANCQDARLGLLGSRVIRLADYWLEELLNEDVGRDRSP